MSEESRKERALRKAEAFAQGVDKGLGEQQRQRGNRLIRVEIEKSGDVADAVIEMGNPQTEQWSFRFSLPEPLPEGATPISDDEAEKLLLERVKKTQSEFQDAALKLARFYSRAGKQAVAVSYIQQQIASTDCPETKAFFYLALGQLMEQVHNYENAVKFYLQAFSLEPVDNGTWYLINNNLGYCLNHFGRFKEAEPYCRTAIEIAPSRYNAYKNLGVSLRGRGQLVEAAKFLILAVRRNSNDPRALKYLEELVATHPTLSTELPDIDRQLQNCRDAVNTAAEFRQKHMSEPVGQIGEGRPKKPKILVTDDCESTLDCLKTVLETCGYDVVTLANKVEALKRLREIQPDLVTTDLASPQMGGIDFIRVVKELDPSIPVIILSGNVTLESAREAVRLGVCDCIDKPFDVVYFRQAVERALKTRGAE